MTLHLPQPTAAAYQPVSSSTSEQLSRTLRLACVPHLAVMALIDKVPGDLKLYIGGYSTLDSFTVLRACVESWMLTNHH